MKIATQKQAHVKNFTVSSANRPVPPLQFISEGSIAGQSMPHRWSFPGNDLFICRSLREVPLSRRRTGLSKALQWPPIQKGPIWERLTTQHMLYTAEISLVFGIKGWATGNHYRTSHFSRPAERFWTPWGHSMWFSTVLRTADIA